MAACNHSRVAQYDAALIVVPFLHAIHPAQPFSPKTPVAITLSADLPIMNVFDRGNPDMFPLRSRVFRLREVKVTPRLVSCENAFEEIMTMNGILMEE